jgi:sulfate transport system permease protein
MGFKVAYTPTGIVVALIFITLPFVVRTLQPVIEDIETEVEEAAATLGASRWQTFVKVIFPAIAPALLTGFALAFSRALGEYGSVIFIAGNLPLISEITPLLIISKLEQYDVLGATALAVVMLGLSFILLLTVNMLQWWAANRHKNSEPLEVAAARAGGGK